MADKLPPATEQPFPVTVEPAAVPLIYFDLIAGFGGFNGIVNVTLAFARHRPDGKGQFVSVPVVAADLRCSLAVAKNLREALDKAILVAETPKGEPN